MNQVYSDPMLDSAIPLGIEAAVPTGYDNAGVVPTDAGGPRRDNDSSLSTASARAWRQGRQGRPDRRRAGRCRQYHHRRRRAAWRLRERRTRRRNPGGTSSSGPATTNTPKDRIGDQPGPRHKVPATPHSSAVHDRALGSSDPAKPGAGLSGTRNAGDHHRPRNTETTADYAATGDDDDRRTASAYSATAPTTGRVCGRHAVRAACNPIRGTPTTVVPRIICTCGRMPMRSSANCRCRTGSSVNQTRRPNRERWRSSRNQARSRLCSTALFHSA